jgi:hypothetical protein
VPSIRCNDQWGLLGRELVQGQVREFLEGLQVGGLVQEVLVDVHEVELIDPLTDKQGLLQKESSRVVCIVAALP